MEEFIKVYEHLYNALEKFNIKLEFTVEQVNLEKLQALYPVFRLIDAQVSNDTLDDHVFLFSPIITESNFFSLKGNNRKVLLVYVKKLYEIMDKMGLQAPNTDTQLQQMLSLFDTSEISATEEDIQQAAATLGESFGLDENDPMRNVMHDIIHRVGNGLKDGKSIQDLIADATSSFKGRISNDMKNGVITEEQIQKSHKMMMEKMEKIMKNPMAAAAMMKTPDQKKKDKDERRKNLRKKWRNKSS